MGIYGQPREWYSDFLHLETFEMIKMTWMQTFFTLLNMNKLFISKSSIYWTVISENKGGITRISDIQKYLKTKFPWLQTIFFVLKHQKNMHLEFLCISEVAAGTMTRLHNKFMKAICTLFRIDCVNPRYATQLLIFCQIVTLTITLTLHCSSTMVGGLQHNSHIFISIGISCFCGMGMCAAFAKCNVDTQYFGVIE